MTVHHLKCQRSAIQTATVASEGGGIGATVRYEDEKGISIGDTLYLDNADTGDRIVVAEVVHVRVVEAYRALDVIRATGAVYHTSYVTHLMEDLNRYYDDVEPTDEVKVIIYDPDPAAFDWEAI